MELTVANNWQAAPTMELTVANNWQAPLRHKQRQRREREERGTPTHLSLQLFSDPREPRTRDAGGDRRDARLVPPNARVDDACSGVFNVLG